MAAIAGPMTIATRSSLPSPARLTSSRAGLSRTSGARRPARAPGRGSGATTCVARATEAGDTRPPGSDAAAYDNASLLRRLGETNATSPVTHRSGVPIFSVARVAATEKTPPSSSSSPSAFQTFGRTYWPFFLVLQTLALIGAAISGVSSRKKRLELASLNEKLRQLAERDDENACAFDWDNLEGQCTDSWPGAPQIAAGTEALKAGNTEAALEAFQEARAACESAFANEKANDAAPSARAFAPDLLSGVDAAAYLAATKGYASCLTKFGGAENLRVAVRALQSVEGLARVAEDETVFGSIADALTDLGDLAGAGAYYDKVLEMD